MVDTIISSMMFEIKISNIMEKLFYLYKIIENLQDFSNIIVLSKAVICCQLFNNYL